MKPSCAILALVLCLTTSACRSDPVVAPAPPSQSGIELFSEPAQALHLEADLALGELLARYTAALGWTLEVSDEWAAELRKQHCDLSGALDIAPQHVHRFVESLLRSHGWFLEFAHAAPPVVLRLIQPAHSRNAPRALVPTEEIARWGAHPAHFVACELRLPGVDAKALAASLAFVFSEPDLVRIVQADDAGLLAVSGPGSDVANLMRIVADIGRGAQLAAQPPQIASEAAHLLELLREPGSPLHLTGGSKNGLSIDELLHTYAELMGWQLLISPAVREQANAQSTGLSSAIDVPAPGVHAFVEGVLRSNGFVLRFAHVEEPVVLEVGSFRVPNGGSLMSLAPLIDAAELARWREHAAFLVQTEVHLPGIDVRSLANSLKTNFSESQALQLRPIADEHLFVLGFASEVAQFLPILRSLAGPAAARAVEPPAAPTSSGVLSLFKTPASAMHLEARKSGTLPVGELIEQYGKLMGWQLLVDPETRNELRNLSCSLALPLDVPADQVHAFVESIAEANDVVFDFVHTTEPVLLEVRGTNVAGRGNPRRRSRLVPASELERWAAHPAFLVSARIDMPGSDVRTLSNTLRQLFSDQQTQQIIPLGSSSLLITGSGADIAGLAQLFRSLEASAGGTHVPLPSLLAGPPLLELLAPPARALQLRAPVSGELKLSNLLEAYAQLTGWQLLISPETRMPLRMLPCGLSLPVDVPREEVHAFVEGILKANDFTMNFAHAQGPVLLQIESTNVAGKGNPKRNANVVSAADLPRWAAHPNFLITTCIDLPGVDVRTLSNSLRQMFSDQQTQQIIPVGNSDSLILTGFGADVAAIAGMLGAVAQGAAGKNMSLPALASPDSGIELLVPPAQGLHLEKPGTDDLPLADLFVQYAQSMGWRILAASEIWAEMRRVRCTFALPVDVPSEQVHGFVEAVAREHGFVFGFAHTLEPVLLRITSTNKGRGNAKQDALLVPPGDLPRWVQHPAFLISTCVDLPGVDVRTLSNSLRQLFSDQQTQQILPVGNSDALIVTGFGSDVARLVSSLAELARGGAGLQAAVIPAPPPADRDRLFPLNGQSFTITAPDGKAPTPLDMLEEFASWTKRPLEMSDEARKVLAAGDRRFEEPRIVPAQLAYPCVGLILARAHCTLSPVPPAAPVKWVIDVVRGAKDVQALDLPTIPFEELGAWSSYCATPFRTFLKLPEDADPKQVENVLKTVGASGLGCRVEFSGIRTLLFCGTPLEMQAAACAILQACAPASPKPR